MIVEGHSPSTISNSLNNEMFDYLFFDYSFKELLSVANMV
jgi:hypothetical protein